MAVDSLAYYFPESVREGMVKWMENLHKLPTTVGLTADKGARVVYVYEKHVAPWMVYSTA